MSPRIAKRRLAWAISTLAAVVLGVFIGAIGQFYVSHSTKKQTISVYACDGDVHNNLITSAGTFALDPHIVVAVSNQNGDVYTSETPSRVLEQIFYDNTNDGFYYVITYIPDGPVGRLRHALNPRMGTITQITLDRNTMLLPQGCARAA